MQPPAVPRGETQDQCLEKPVVPWPRLRGATGEPGALSSLAGHGREADGTESGKNIWKPYNGPSAGGQDFWKKAPIKLLLFFAATGLAAEDPAED